ncbi:putative peroxisome biosynthesis protein (PAS10/Peroxin-12) [Aspergillus japonicus CBS 114.51]|uniref:Peroxisome assembly protein 12 n=1 Tax=Aspergillus japonicus CBS 114.51 TaxID=1448312 RepID=A0A8T8XHA9_ASPJA|nr:putative peroxisome biosynthesis protein (PAS10/Peroxin-12) [Aspergillus japonicus CBS 114.51]RAH87646.1 putative peroxisome biosynthesis protein (PAS10/Peroxin-12) [Aspergillus japonicus CBS 114.51]
MEYLPSLQQEFDELKPSLFELLAEQQLSDLLPPSIRYILAVATHRHPRYLLRILNSYDEIYALLSLLVERYYLRTFGGSFTENFYSLKRERVLLTKNGEIPRAQIGAPGPVRDALKLRTRDVWKNLLIMVGIPYLKRKLDEGYDIHAAPHASLIMSGGPRYNPGDELPPRPTLRQRLFHFYKWFLRNIYPSLNAGYYLTILAFNLAYLFDNTKYSSPFLWLIGTRIRRLSSADHRAIAAVLDPPPTPATPSRSRSRPGSSLLGLLSPQNLHAQLLTSLRYFLPASIFALKFLEWYHASDFSRQLARKATEVLDLPAPVANGMTPPSQRRSTTTTTTTKDPKNADEKSSASSPQLKSALKSPTSDTQPQQQDPQDRRIPISASSYLPIFTVPLPAADSETAQACPVCLNTLTNPTACQTGYVFCYVCVFHWLNGEHQRQIDFMDGEAAAGAPWEEEDLALEAQQAKQAGGEAGDGEGEEGKYKAKGSRRGKWESGRGRCPVTGRRVLGGTEGLRRVLV